MSVPERHSHADTRAQPLGHEYLGVAVDGNAVGVGVHTGSELHVGYAVRSVTPHVSYTPRLMQSARPTLSNAEEMKMEVTRSTFHDAMFALNANAASNACAPSHPRSTPTGRRSHVSARMRGRPNAQSRARSHTSAAHARIR